MKNLTITAAVVAILALYGIAGNGDYEEAMAQQAEYCERVSDGVHEHYNKDIDCNDANNEGE